jgi:hypothetical protein
MYGPAAYASELQALSGAGALQRQIEQERMLSDLQRWYSGEEINGVSNPMYNPMIQLIFQYLGLSPYAVGQQGFNIGAGVGGGQ